MTLPPESTRHRFDLMTEPWLPVMLTDGTPVQFGLKDFYTHAHKARGLNEPSPLAYTAVMRFLLAIVHRAIRGPKDPLDWAERWRSGRFNEAEINRYLDDHESRFDLFHHERPFAQVGPDVVVKDSSPVTRLFMERTSGNNPTLFDHAWDDEPPALSPGEAARALLTAHAYAFAGSGGRFFNAPMIAGYSVLLEGNTLFQTLMLNLQEYSDDEPRGLERTDDAPWWEVEGEPEIERGGNMPRGLTDLLTWRSRAIRLIPDDDGSVRRCFYSQRYQVRESETLRDPFKRYEPAQSGDNKGKLFPKNFVAGRALWRDSYALMEQQRRDDATGTVYTPRPGIVAWLSTAMNQLAPAERVTPVIVASGLVNNQAKIDLWRMDRLPLPIELLDDKDRRLRVRDAVEGARNVRDALYRAGTTFASEGLSLGERSPDPKDVARERASLKLDERYWSRLDTPFQGFLIDLAAVSDPDTALSEWFAELRRIARTVYIEATTVASLDGRWFRAQSQGSWTLDRQLKKALIQLLDADDHARETQEEVA